MPTHFYDMAQQKIQVSQPKNIFINTLYYFTVSFTDENKFKLYGSDGKIFVWRKQNIEFHHQIQKPLLSMEGPLIWFGVVCQVPVVDNLYFIVGRMDKLVYLDMSKQNLKHRAEKLGMADIFAFYEDNGLKRTSTELRVWAEMRIKKKQFYLFSFNSTFIFNLWINTDYL